MSRWHDDPVQFAGDVFGVRCWSRQREILGTVARSNRVTVASGHKCSKSHSCALLAWWWIVTRPGARVILLAPTYRQIVEIVWREVRELHARARWPLGGELFTKPEEGFRTRDGKQIFGFSTEGKERVAGFSGNILYVLDEASGIADEVHEVVSTSPTGRVVMISNPTRNEGAFYRSHHSGGDVWTRVHISSEEAAAANPIVTVNGERRPMIRGVADDDWINARRTEYGEGSYYYDVRVRGLFSRQADNAMIPTGLVDAAQKRWSATKPDGLLEVGVDVARFGTDDSSIVWRRGKWSASPEVFHGNDNVVVAGKVLEVIARERVDGEIPIVRVDTSGLGAGVADILRAQASEQKIEVVDVQAQESATDEQHSRRRDQVWAELRKWLAEGGAIVDDDRLRADLVSPTYGFDERGRIKVEGKRELKKRLKRSTDRADALGLAVFALDRADGWAPIVARGPSTR